MDYKVSGFDFHNWIGNQKRGKNAYLQIGDGIASDRRCSVRRGLRVRSEMDGNSDDNRSDCSLLEIGSLACCNAAWDRQIGSLVPSNKRRHSLYCLINWFPNPTEVSNREKWVRQNMEAIRLFRDRREMCEENKRKKKKTKALQTIAKIGMVLVFCIAVIVDKVVHVPNRSTFWETK